MMRADYDSAGDTIQIELSRVRKLGHSEVVENGAVIVGIHEDRPVMVDVIGTRNDFEGPLRVAAERYELDAEALIAAANAALAAPDRTVTLDVGVRAAA
jgi:predicted RNA-binding protein